MGKVANDADAEMKKAVEAAIQILGDAVDQIGYLKGKSIDNTDYLVCDREIQSLIDIVLVLAKKL